MKSYYLEGAKTLTMRDVEIPEPAADQVRIKVARVGICGSDVHYFQHGYCGAFVPKEPFALGHEFAGVIDAVGADVDASRIGERVAADPIMNCYHCEFCEQNKPNLCLNKRFIGTASSYPHHNGAYSEYVLAPAANAVPLPDNVSFAMGALLEPASVSIHALKRAASCAGPLAGKKMLITGAGAIGQLVLACAQAMDITDITVSDIKKSALDFSLAHGASHAINPMDADYQEQVDNIAPGGFDLIIESSGAPAACASTIHLAKRAGTIVQIGTLPEAVSLPANLIMVKELNFIGTLQFVKQFPEVLELLSSGKLNIDHIISRTMPFDQLVDGMLIACDNNSDAIKVHVEVIS